MLLPLVWSVSPSLYHFLFQTSQYPHHPTGREGLNCSLPPLKGEINPSLTALIVFWEFIFDSILQVIFQFHFEKNFDNGYEQFKIGVLLKQARLEAGLTQDEVAKILNTKKSAISRIENHAEDIRLSTLANYAQAVGKNLHLKVA